MPKRILAFLCAACLAESLRSQERPAEKPERKTAFKFNETIPIGGKVLAVTKDSILIAKDKEPPMTYPAHDCLAAGKVHTLVRPETSYLLVDLKPGDTVFLDTIMEGKQTFCVSIQITERPGGLIPAGQLVDEKLPYHEMRNAQIAFREKGTPIPDHLIPKPLSTPLRPKK